MGTLASLRHWRRQKMHRYVCFTLACSLTVNGWAQVRSAMLQNREVWQIESPQLRVTITQVGGHVAEITSQT